MCLIFSDTVSAFRAFCFKTDIVQIYLLMQEPGKLRN